MHKYVPSPHGCVGAKVSLLLKNIRTVLTLLLSLFVLSFPGGCKPGNDGNGSGRVSGPPGAQVTICTGGALAVLPLLARENGFFARQGLNAEVVAKDDGLLAMKALFSGECDFATSGESPVALQSFERNDFVILAEIARSENTTRIIARRDSGIRSASDLQGKVVGVRKGTMSHFFLDLFLKKHGIRAGRVTLRFMEPDRLAEALERGEIAAYSGADELVLQGVRMLGSRAVILSEPGLCLNSAYLVVRRDFVNTNRALVLKVLAALLEAEQFAMSRPDDVLDIVARVRGGAKSELETILLDQSQQVALRQSMLLTLEDHARWMMDIGVAGKRSLPNFLDLLEPAPLKALKPSAVSISR